MQDQVIDILRFTFLGNTVQQYLIFIGIMLSGFLFKTLVSKLFSAILFKAVVQRFTKDVTTEEFKRLLVTPFEVISFLVFFYVAFDQLNYPPELGLPGKEELGLKRILQRIYSIFLICALTWVIMRLVDFIGMMFSKRAARTLSKLDDQLVPFFVDFSKVIIVIIGFFVILGTVFKVNVAGLVAGLGVGGLAIAFAAKESLENLLASFTIFLDHPFVVGDLVQVGEITGTIEKIGFRSTRIRTLEKSYVTLPNKSMIDKPLDNLTLRTFRRVKFDIFLTHSTTAEQLQAIVTDIQALIDGYPRTNQDGRIRFINIGPYSKDIMVLYFIDSVDYDIYIDVKEEINYQIVEIVKKHGAAFAFPTQTVYLKREE
ncbi:mechanosensitive ion channel family protein [Rufibacter glacialis]|uniref:Mechanosensitive ion channel n=1 Tax=Rufibacter glacialis TaxID=1259555 RepID=A0A5M8QEK9_9BACT|nr:mechanosensitive ion channel domain-containing protein [Rufibacter glacialis]KAA6433423.1 mechanosensitive ion channel [Rufibacter glacialis]GGK74341.1 mechanosensitive ion channel protein [Rufibacter glacialis]